MIRYPEMRMYHDVPFLSENKSVFNFKIINTSVAQMHLKQFNFFFVTYSNLHLK